MPGAGKQTPEIQASIKELLEAGFDPTTIHRKLKVGRSSIYRMKRCLQKHGTAYMPVELNKKNGRPKVLTPEQELEVRDWLRDPKNRTRYLDDLVWLIHDRFGIVCSTTTMSKMKRKWLKAIESEETGQPLDESTRQLIMETHPDLPILHHQPPMVSAQMMPTHISPQSHVQQQRQPPQQQQQPEHQYPQENQYPEPPETQLDARLQAHEQVAYSTDAQLDLQLRQHAEMAQHHHQQQQQQQQLDHQFQQQLQQEMANQQHEIAVGEPHNT